MEPQWVDQSDDCYPKGLSDSLGEEAPAGIAAMGDIGILHHRLLGLICSVQCPGSAIIKAHDASRALRDAGVAVAGGFHSPMEKECLRLLLRGAQPIVICPARSIDGMRIPVPWRKPLEDGRLLLLSPFLKKQHRATKQNAICRNRFVAALAGRILILHAAPGGNTEQLCREALGWDKPVCTLADDANARLAALGARPVAVSEIVEWCAEDSVTAATVTHDATARREHPHGT